MTPTPAYPHGKQEDEKELVAKHEIRSGNEGWEGWRHVGRLNLCHEPKFKGKCWDRESSTVREVMKKKAVGAQTEATRQSRTAPHATERNKKTIEFLRTDRR